MKVLTLLAKAGVEDRLWGRRICQLTNLGPGSVYPILERLEREGFVRGYRETEAPSGRPRRRYYELTRDGRLELAEAHATSVRATNGARRSTSFGWAP
ncbi:PadR family transcriptional regulator [Virgisporangium aliadipatigenens]